MGQQVDPRAYRLEEIDDYDNIWFSTQNYAIYLKEDYDIRKYCSKQLKQYPISQLIIKRKSSDNLLIDIYSSKPGMILGKNGDNIYLFKSKIIKEFKKKIHLKIIETKNPERSPKLLAEMVAAQLEKRVPFRRAMKMAVQTAMKSGVEGIQVRCSGRLGGVEIARSEWYQHGRMPLHTIRAKIKYHYTTAYTIYGIIGIKVWINDGEKLKDKQKIMTDNIKDSVSGGVR